MEDMPEITGDSQSQRSINAHDIRKKREAFIIVTKQQARNTAFANSASSTASSSMRSLPAFVSASSLWVAFGFVILVLVLSTTTATTRNSSSSSSGPSHTSDVPLPSTNQLNALQFRSLAMFQHFSINPWKSIEHNCVGHSSDCLPAKLFHPTNLSTDQWIETAARLGAHEICLTAHHEGGFCLWNTQYSNYSVMHSPYGKDIVQEFISSLVHYNRNKTAKDQISPCYYMGPNANGYLTNVMNLSSEAFVEAQLGMLTELLENYELQPTRLWWDHYGKGCDDANHLNPCPPGSFPDAWPRFVQLVRDKSPTSLICPGPDCDGHQGESGVAKYPSWNACEPTEDGLHCHHQNSSSNADTRWTDFQPYEACATMTKGWFCHGDGNDQQHWNASDIWDHYMASVGEGWINTLNAPVCTTGQIHPGLVDQIEVFGSAVKSLFDTVHAAHTDIVGHECDNATIIELPVYGDYNAVILQEDLSKGQRIAKYAIDYYNYEEWIEFSTVHGQSVGNLMIDWVDPPKQPSTIVRLRCLKAFQLPIYLQSVSVHTGTRPNETTMIFSNFATAC